MQRCYSLVFEAMHHSIEKVHALVEGDQIEHLEERSLVGEVVVAACLEVGVVEADPEEACSPFGRVGSSVEEIDLAGEVGGFEEVYFEEERFEEEIAPEEYWVVVEYPSRFAEGFREIYLYYHPWTYLVDDERLHPRQLRSYDRLRLLAH